ncbi:hypothetical protein ACUL41_06235 [Virgibacillus natechei]
MRFIIIMFILMIAGGAVGAYVDDKLLRPIIIGIGLLAFLSLSLLLFKKRN